ncbi:hypothetical protein ISP17_15120 [Dyella ginsengisoli]|uniref:Fibronectin type-III domain-containing protein n=1 Tax=Dyella ginsengisoli TaxID=363848 RepID=A0ABW8JVV8_9GAMM
MKIVYGALAALMMFTGVANAADNTHQLAAAVQGTTVTVDGRIDASTPNLKQQAELVQALQGMQTNGPVANWSPGPGCVYNCPLPVGSISASPSIVYAPAGGMGSVSIRWTWDESRSQPVAQYSCLWVSGNGEPNAHVVQCEHPGNTYTTNLNWIAAGSSYVFRVAPGNPNGPYTQPISYLNTLASTTVVGVAR